MPAFRRISRELAKDRDRENPEKGFAKKILARPGNDSAGICNG
jgi:hypothetical protein